MDEESRANMRWEIRKGKLKRGLPRKTRNKQGTSVRKEKGLKYIRAMRDA